VVDARESMGVIADRPTHDVVDRAPSFGAVGARDATRATRRRRATPRARRSVTPTATPRGDDANGRRERTTREPSMRSMRSRASTTDARRATGD
jgi:hypothetical protein